MIKYLDAWKLWGFKTVCIKLNINPSSFCSSIRSGFGKVISLRRAKFSKNSSEDIEHLVSYKIQRAHKNIHVHTICKHHCLLLHCLFQCLLISWMAIKIICELQGPGLYIHIFFIFSEGSLRMYARFTHDTPWFD